MGELGPPDTPGSLGHDRADRLRRSLAEAGLLEEDIPGRLLLVTQAVLDFRRLTSQWPQSVWWVPGRIEVFGKHTDYAGGRSLVAAVPRGFAVAAGARPDAVLAAYDARWQAATAIDLRDPSRAFTGWANYVAVVGRRLARNFPGASLGADIVFASDLPRAAGVSSSSALVVGVSLALIRRARLEERPEWTAAIHSPLDLAGYLGATENGLTFGPLAGLAGVGTHGGSEDHTAVLDSQPEQVSAYAYVPVRSIGRAPLPASWRFVVMPSGVEAAKAGAARGAYNEASLATRALVDVWRRHTRQDAPTLAAAVATEGDGGGANAMQAAIDAVGHADFSPEALRLRLEHFIAEDARVPRALLAIRDADADALGDLAEASQRDASDKLRNQVPATVALARLAREAGAFAASSFGAGFGGSVWALVGADEAAAFAARWQERYVREFPDVRRAAPFIARPAPGARELTLSE